MSDAASFIATLRREVRELPPYNAGRSADSVRAQYGVAHVAPLASNENPSGASPRAHAALLLAVSDDIHRYPDPSCSALREAIAGTLDVDPARLLFGNGSEDLLSIAAHTLLAPGDEVVTVVPSFGLHIIYPQAAGATVKTVPMRDLSFDVDALCAALSPRTRMLVLSNPSNPVGAALDHDAMKQLLAALSPQTFVIWDEAYHEYASSDPSYPDALALLAQSASPWLVLRTFSKAYGLAGLRIGYGIASDARLAELMNRLRTPFNINRPAQSAALAAWHDRAHLAAVIDHVRRERERMRAALLTLGYAPAPSCANFLFFDAHEDGAALAQRLMTEGVIVKPWREPGYSDCVRVSIGSRDDNDLFVAALRRVRCVSRFEPASSAASRTAP